MFFACSRCHESREDEMSEEQGAQTSDTAYSLTLNENEREVVTRALQELLSTTEREEHLIKTVEALLERIKAL
jgi:hypothetical protein